MSKDGKITLNTISRGRHLLFPSLATHSRPYLLYILAFNLKNEVHPCPSHSSPRNSQPRRPPRHRLRLGMDESELDETWNAVRCAIG